ncbi:condensin complex subunit 2-like, partial [Asbolus verrucosus]
DHSRNDDEHERSNRRNMVAMQRRLTNITSTNSSPLIEINQITDEVEVKDHLRICTKLYTENKISIKNAWELHIIDIIRKITLADNANVLQVAGSSLDIKNIELSATDNLFTFKLHTNPASHQFMLMSQMPYWVTDPDLILENTDEGDIETPEVSDFTMCQPFKDFEISEWDPDEEEKQLINNSTVHNVVLDDDGLLIAELDGSLHDIFKDNGIPEKDGDEFREEFCVQIHGEIAQIVDAIPEENRLETEYGYNTLIKTASGKFIDRIWAGPSHWKVKFNRRSTARYSGSTVPQVAKCTRKVKTQQRISFNTIPENVLETTAKYVVKRVPSTVSLQKTILPLPELSFESFHKITDELLSKPGVRSQHGAKDISREAQNCEVPVYNYENPNDSQYCSQHNADDGHYDDPMQHFFEEGGSPAGLQNFLSENLVNVPEMVATSHVSYAMQAKKMDMKKLKAAVWKRLTQDSGQNNVNATIIKPVQFSQVYKDIPNYLSKDMRKELSCPLAFVALLHLCNENNLVLRQMPNCNDFCIIKASE